MSTFTYKVTVTVEDDLGGPTECYNEDYFDWCVIDRDEETGEVTLAMMYPDDKANLIMQERLGHDEELNGVGDYSIEYEVQP